MRKKRIDHFRSIGQTFSAPGRPARPNVPTDHFLTLLHTFSAESLEPGARGWGPGAGGRGPGDSGRGPLAGETVTEGAKEFRRNFHNQINISCFFIISASRYV